MKQPSKPNPLEMLIRSEGYSLRSFAEKCGIPSTTLYGIVKNDIGGASIDTVLIICKNLHITVEELDAMMKGQLVENEPSYDDLQHLIARNGNKLTVEEKMKLIKMLSKLEEDEEE